MIVQALFDMYEKARLMIILILKWTVLIQLKGFLNRLYLIFNCRYDILNNK